MLIVDDSALIRAVLRDVVLGIDGFEVVGTAADGNEAIAAVRSLRPDIVTLDVEMPGLDGLATLEVIMRDFPRPVVMLSGADTDGGVDLTLRALELGAVDFVRKADVSERDPGKIPIRLRTALLAAAATNVGVVSRASTQQRAVVYDGAGGAAHPGIAAPVQRSPAPGARAPVGLPARSVVVVAASTGGPRALGDVVAGLAADHDFAMLMAQHMPSGFTARLARRLSKFTRFAVTEATDGEIVRQGTVYLAPGGQHMRVAAGSGGTRIVLDDGPTVWGVRPAADPLFVSAAQLYGEACVGVVLTGMGRDGALGLSAVREAGGGAVVQDEASSAVYGMPREAFAIAGADRTVTPAGVAGAAHELLARHRVLK
ncbi:MAG: chemotaxis-specific protein-glutamate methyltransferase CheB [Gemmatimonadetes bacterium]|nr:chemotaxis-specific protein-glutamate methyltransferase CheB [Gemmatimonadota bacterium]